ncbi:MULTISPECIES: hypothetical protein [Burkholderia cepacia complex]|uniref:hypothetical protein n=1 Tax=Burkholderia cepacia complex TaxID=87882 RepID=UPI00064BADBC|nr:MULTISPECIES: hypothetical protein [Burkholderia cepacia complex]AKM02486.1 hypothetical protein ABD05_19820 [Burkholderia pyrrocinia]GAU05555.1 conserved exported protein of unknown function [Burkholderia stabilis]
MRSETRKIAGIAAMVCGGVTSVSAAAMQDGAPAATVEPAVQTSGAHERNWPATGAIALSDARLDAMRGGFDMPGGLKVSFGVSRVAFVNGNLVTTTNFNIPDISHITAQQAQALAAANAGALIQVGAGNAAQPAALPALTGAVIQNTLSNQQIQAVTTINTTVNTLSTFKNLNVMSTLNNALLGALPGR